MSEDGNPDEGQGPASDRMRRKDRPVTDNPDVHLDAPQLKVDELNLSLLGILTADIKGLDTELLLEADLENLVSLLKRIVDALEDDEDSASDMIEALGRAIGVATGRSYPVGSGDGAGSPRQALEAVKHALDSYGERSSAEGDGSMRYEVDANGEITRITLNEAGEVTDEQIVGNVSELSGERG